MSIKEFHVCNPLDMKWYADPEARFYEGKYWIYGRVIEAIRTMFYTGGFPFTLR